MKNILRCEKCDIYTMEEDCPKCNSKALSNKPAKWSPEDKMGHYRRLYKKQQSTSTTFK